MTPKAMGQGEMGLRDTGVEALSPSPSVGAPTNAGHAGEGP